MLLIQVYPTSLMLSPSNKLGYIFKKLPIQYLETNNEQNNYPTKFHLMRKKTIYRNFLKMILAVDEKVQMIYKIIGSH